MAGEPHDFFNKQPKNKANHCHYAKHPQLEILGFSMKQVAQTIVFCLDQSKHNFVRVACRIIGTLFTTKTSNHRKNCKTYFQSKPDLRKTQGPKRTVLFGGCANEIMSSCFAFVRREFKFWAYAYMPTCRQRIRRTAGRTGEIWVGPGMYAHFQVHARRRLSGGLSIRNPSKLVAIHCT